MKSFLKNNILSIIFCTLMISGLSFANTITRPYSSADYAGGVKAVGSKVNAEFQNIVSWLNGGNISSGNVAALGISTSNLANQVVTAAKLAPISSTSSLITSFSSSSTVTGADTGLSRSVTTSGRPVFVRLFGTSGSSQLKVQSSTTAIVLGVVEIYRDATLVSSQTFGASTQSTATDFGAFAPPSGFMHIDYPSAGTYTYTAKVYVNNSSVTITLTGISFEAFEF